MTLKEFMADLVAKSILPGYWKWQLERLQSVTIVPAIEALGQKVDKRKYGRAKHCHATARKIMEDFQGVRMVQGYMAGGYPIPHSWNEKDGKHFDLTAERQKWDAREYGSILVLGNQELWPLVTRAGLWTDFIPFAYEAFCESKAADNPAFERLVDRVGQTMEGKLRKAYEADQKLT